MKSSTNGIAIALGVVGLVIGIFGSMLFGFICGILGIAMGVGAAILGINTKNATQQQQGTAGLVLGIISAAFGLIFLIGCLGCGGSYGKWGCVCGANKVLSDAGDAYSDALSQLNDALSSFK